MNRRQFLHSSAAFSASTMLSGCYLLPQKNQTLSPEKTWKLGWKSIDSDTLAPIKLVVEGKIPEALYGKLYRNGPAKYERNGERYQHWFDGDGMVQKYHISEQGITHRGQFIHTEKYLAEQQAQQFLYSAAGTNFANKMPSRNNDSINTANTSLIQWNNEMLALWEGGSAYKLDVSSLQTQGIKTWAPELKHMPFSAHPKVDPKGFLWNFGLVPYFNKTPDSKGSLIVYKLKANSNEMNYQLIPLPFAGYVHDFAQTQSKLIFYISPYHFSHQHGSNYVQRFRWQPELGGRLIVVEKDDLSKHRVYDAPAGFVFHFGQAWERGSNINLVASWHHTPEIMAKGMYEVLTANKVDYAKSHASIITLDQQSGKCSLQESATELEFPGFDQERNGNLVFGVGRKPGSPHHNDRHPNNTYHFANSTLSWNAISGKQDEYFFDDGIIAEEPLFIPDRNKSLPGAGWLLQTTLNYKKARTEIYVFDALSIAKGPIATAHMDRATPLGFHGTFIGQA